MNIFENLFPGGLFSFSRSVSWQKVQKWITVAGNLENIEVGYAGLGEPLIGRDLGAEIFQ